MIIDKVYYELKSEQEMKQTIARLNKWDGDTNEQYQMDDVQYST